MSRGLSTSGIVFGILTFILAVYIRLFLFTFDSILEMTLIYSTIILGLVGLIINSVVLIKRKEGKVFSIIGLILIILAILIPIIFKIIA